MREVVQSESLGKRFDMESVVTFMHEVEGVRPAMQRPAQTLQLSTRQNRKRPRRKRCRMGEAASCHCCRLFQYLLGKLDLRRCRYVRGNLTPDLIKYAIINQPGWTLQQPMPWAASFCLKKPQFRPPYDTDQDTLLDNLNAAAPALFSTALRKVRAIAASEGQGVLRAI